MRDARDAFHLPVGQAILWSEKGVHKRTTRAMMKDEGNAVDGPPNGNRRASDQFPYGQIWFRSAS